MVDVGNIGIQVWSLPSRTMGDIEEVCKQIKFSLISQGHSRGRNPVLLERRFCERGESSQRSDTELELERKLGFGR